MPGNGREKSQQGTRNAMERQENVTAGNMDDNATERRAVKDRPGRAGATPGLESTSTRGQLVFHVAISRNRFITG